MLPWYASDEFDSACTISLTFDPLWRLQSGAVQVENLISVTIDVNYHLVAENRLRCTFPQALSITDDVKASFTWEVHPDVTFSIPFFEKYIDKNVFLSNNEELHITIDGGGEKTTYHPISIRATHDTSAVIDELGSITATVTTGVDYESPTGALRLVIGGGVEARFQF